MSFGVGLPRHRSRPRRDTPRIGASESKPVLLTTDAWRKAFPSAVVGALVMGAVRNPELSPSLEAAKRLLEERLRDAAGAWGPGGGGGAGGLRGFYRAPGDAQHA